MSNDSNLLRIFNQIAGEFVFEGSFHMQYEISRLFTLFDFTKVPLTLRWRKSIHENPGNDVFNPLESGIDYG